VKSGQGRERVDKTGRVRGKRALEHRPWSDPACGERALGVRSEADRGRRWRSTRRWSCCERHLVHCQEKAKEALARLSLLAWVDANREQTTSGSVYVSLSRKKSGRIQRRARWDLVLSPKSLNRPDAVVTWASSPQRSADLGSARALAQGIYAPTPCERKTTKAKAAGTVASCGGAACRESIGKCNLDPERWLPRPAATVTARSG
jgi:hypothetical protein